jgi:hypothetical protein
MSRLAVSKDLLDDVHAFPGLKIETGGTRHSAEAQAVAQAKT